MFPPPEPGAFHVLCLGDSLTEGYTLNGTDFSPYTDTLQVLLAAVVSIPVVVYNEGKSGDRVLGPFMHRRLTNCLEEADDADVVFDWVIVMAGINDVGNPQTTAHELHTGLEKIISTASRSAKKVLVMNCMETTLDGQYPRMLQVVQQYNALILEGASTKPNVYFLDIRGKIPYSSSTFDDHVHLTSAGYNKMGEVIFHRMQELGLQ
jgi:lysophospholipase L1-like esterase